MKQLSTDPARELVFGKMKEYLLKEGIRPSAAAAEQHTQQSPVERTIGVLTVMGRSAMLHMNVRPDLWPEGIMHATHVRDLLPCSSNPGHMSPLQMWEKLELPPSVSHLKTFGSRESEV